MLVLVILLLIKILAFAIDKRGLHWRVVPTLLWSAFYKSIAGPCLRAMCDMRRNVHYFISKQILLYTSFVIYLTAATACHFQPHCVWQAVIKLFLFFMVVPAQLWVAIGVLYSNPQFWSSWEELFAVSERIE